MVDDTMIFFVSFGSAIDLNLSTKIVLRTAFTAVEFFGFHTSKSCHSSLLFIYFLLLSPFLSFVSFF